MPRCGFFFFPAGISQVSVDVFGMFAVQKLWSSATICEITTKVNMFTWGVSFLPSPANSCRAHWGKRDGRTLIFCSRPQTSCFPGYFTTDKHCVWELSLWRTALWFGEKRAAECSNLWGKEMLLFCWHSATCLSIWSRDAEFSILDSRHK